jgi:two-component system sensor histidine kinase UhpB
MKIRFLFILNFFCLLRPCFSQRGGDSAIESDIRLAFHLAVQKPDSALPIAEKGLLRAARSGNKRLAAYSYKTKGWAEFHQGSYDSAFADLNRATQLFKQMHDSAETMYMYINTGIALSGHSRFVDASFYLLMADTLSDLLNNKRIKAEVNRQMGILFREQGDYKRSIGYFRESMALNLSIQDTAHYAEAATSLSIVFMEMSLPDSSLAILNKCAAIVRARQGNYQRAMLDERFGDTYFALSRNGDALEKYREAFGIFSANDEKADMAYEALNVGKTYEKMKSVVEAEKYLLTSFRVADSVREIHYAKDAANELAALYKGANDWKNAYKWVSIRDNLSDSLQLQEQNERTSQLTAKYEADKKDKEIVLLKKDQELNGITAQRQRAFQYGAIILVVLLLLIGILVINRYRIVQKNKRLIELEKMRSHIARDLHDDMGSTLSSINIISRMALEKAKGEEVSSHLEKIKDNSGNMLDSMSEIVWAINPGNDTLDRVIMRMKEFAGDILDPLNIRYEFRVDGDFGQVKLDLSQRRDFYLIFKEGVNNAAKYSDCKRLDIRLAKEYSTIRMQIIDDGTGFDTGAVRQGNGLRNMQQRALQMQGSLQVASTQGEGTTITLQIRSHD